MDHCQTFASVALFMAVVPVAVGNTADQSETDIVNAAVTFQLPVNTAPIAANDSAVVTSIVGVPTSVLDNDSDADGILDPATVTTSTNLAPAHGVLEIDEATGVVTYFPFTGVADGTIDQYGYTVKDNEGMESAMATVTVTFKRPPVDARPQAMNDTADQGETDILNAAVTVQLPVNTAPIAANDSAVVTSIVGLPISVLNNDSDADGILDPTTVAPSTSLAPVYGGLEIDEATGVVTYFPFADVADGTIDQFGYTVKDNEGMESAMATVAVTFERPPVNAMPQAMNDTAEVTSVKTVFIDVLSNDTDSDGQINPATITATPSQLPKPGSIPFQSTSGVITYTSDPETYAGTVDRFGDTVRDDGGLDSAASTVTVTFVELPNEQAQVSTASLEVIVDTALVFDAVDKTTDVDRTTDATTVDVSALAERRVTSIDQFTGVVTNDANAGVSAGKVDQLEPTGKPLHAEGVNPIEPAASDAFIELSENDFLTEEGEVIASVSLRGDVQLSDGIIAYVEGRDLLVPFEQLMFLLEFPIQVSEGNQGASGWFIREDRRFDLDVATGVVLSDGQTYRLDQTLLRVIEAELYVSVSQVSVWFPLDLRMDLRALELVIEPREQIAIEEQIDRQHREFGSTIVSYARFPERETPYRLVSIPALGVDLSAGARSGEGAELFSSYSLRADGDLFWSSASLLVFGNDTAISDARLRLGRENPRGGLLGQFDATQVQAGDVSGASIPLVSKSTAGRGFRIARRPTGFSGTLDTVTIEGPIEPGFEVELYRNDILLAVDRILFDWNFMEHRGNAERNWNSIL